MTMTQPHLIPSTWTPRRIILGTLVVLLVIAGFLLLYRFRQVAVIVFSGIVISIAIAPSVDWLQKRGLPRSLSVILIYLVLLVLIVISLVLLVPPIIEQLNATVPRIESYYQDLKGMLLNSPLLALRQIASQLPAQLNLTPSAAGSPSAQGSLDAVGEVLNTTGSIFSGLFTLTAIFLIGFYWTLEGEGITRLLLLRLPNDKRESTREILSEIEMRVGGYVRGQGIMALTIMVADFVIFLLIGLPAALPVAVLAGLFEVIPVLGPTLGAIPAILVAFSSDSSKVVLVIVAGALVQLFENNVLAPRVMHKAVGINPIVTLLAIVAFGALFGFAGLLLAIPIAAIIQIFVDRSLLRPQASGLEAPLGRDRLSKLRFDVQEFVVDVRKLAQNKPTGTAESEVDPIEDSLEGMAMELDQLLSPAALPEDAS
ncbi:MAG: AI-2E family transporter [Anaerolineae bacterium]|nr:AI-2E family transporter [Anaerolineae bacterium]